MNLVLTLLLLFSRRQRYPQQRYLLERDRQPFALLQWRALVDQPQRNVSGSALSSGCHIENGTNIAPVFPSTSLTVEALSL